MVLKLAPNRKLKFWQTDTTISARHDRPLHQGAQADKSDPAEKRSHAHANSRYLGQIGRSMA
jgi:hypothetical protein